jgi:hypothetical protein
MAQRRSERRTRWFVRPHGRHVTVLTLTLLVHARIRTAIRLRVRSHIFCGVFLQGHGILTRSHGSTVRVSR